MTHTMTEEEYAQYLKDKKEIDEYRFRKKELPKRIRDYFEMIKKWKESENSPGWLIVTGCEQEMPGYKHCDFCPVAWFFKECPLGHLKDYSK